MSGPTIMGEHVMKSKTFKIVRRAAAEDMAACLDCLMTALSADDYEAVDFFLHRIGADVRFIRYTLPERKVNDANTTSMA